jgi:hypothetical protein
LSSIDQGAHMIDLFNDVGLDVFVPGNHEFDFGKDNYFERMGEARFPILAANLTDAAGLRSRPLPRPSTAAPGPSDRGNPRSAISSPMRSARSRRRTSRSSMAAESEATESIRRAPGF